MIQRTVGEASDKASDKAEKQAEQVGDTRSVIEVLGDRIKSSMVICMRGGEWVVPPGQVTLWPAYGVVSNHVLNNSYHL